VDSLTEGEGIKQRALAVSPRAPGDILLLCVTSIELTALLILSPTLAVPDWIYVAQHVMVLAIALTRRRPTAEDHSFGSSAAVAVAYGYPYAQVIYLQSIPGLPLWPAAGIVLIMCGAVLSLASLLTLGRWFGIRPALRGLAVRGPYGLVRHPMYLGYLLGDVGYNLQESNLGTAVLVVMGWISLVYRIQSEERVMAHHPAWHTYANSVRYRLVPGIW
jgi:protein-S-isoprenylcysteine O-methyltransferase Ste14